MTTHSMEKGEAVCSKMAIQDCGQLPCFGAIQQVKARYGTGYEVFDAGGSGRRCVPQHVRRACHVEQADDEKHRCRFIKPHAATDKVKDLAMASLKRAGLKNVKECSIKAKGFNK